MSENPIDNFKFNGQYVILVRHGARDKTFDSPRSKTHLKNDNEKNLKKVDNYHFYKPHKDGLSKSKYLAGWLAETLDILKQGSKFDKIGKIISSEEVHSKETIELAYLDVMKKRGHAHDDLKPEYYSELNSNESHFEKSIPKMIVKKIQPEKNGEALLICGHQPQLTWIANKLLKNGKPLPLGESEAAFIELKKYWFNKMRWIISDENPELELELKEKLKSKMDVAKFFSGVISLFLGILIAGFLKNDISDKLNNELYFYLGTLLILLSLGFCVSAIFAYDQLLMPSLFWRSKASIFTHHRFGEVLKRSPTQVHIILYYSTIRVWNLFRIGVNSFVIGVLLILYSIFNPSSLLHLTISVIAMLSVPVSYYLLKPKLGIGD